MSTRRRRGAGSRRRSGGLRNWGRSFPAARLAHTLRHSYARHLLMNGTQINYLSRWLGHSSIQTTLIYLELVPDPSGSLDRVP